jgi:hypothetical protein
MAPPAFPIGGFGPERPCCQDVRVTDPLLRGTPAPVRAAGICIAIVVALGILSLVMVLVQGGTVGFGVVAFVLAAFALLNVRRVAEGNSAARVIATVICVVLIVYRVAFLYLLLGFENTFDGGVITLVVVQLVPEVLLLAAAVVLLYRPAVTALLKR